MRGLIVFFIVIFFIMVNIGCNENRLIPTPVEQVRPTFKQMIAPRDSAFSYSCDSTLIMAFSEAMNPNTFPNNFFLWENEDKTTAVPGTFQASGNNIIFKPNSPLLNAHEYFVELKSRVQDINGNGIDRDTLVVFQSEFLTSGEYSKNGFPEFFVSNGAEDFMARAYVKDQRLTADTAFTLANFGRQLEMEFTKDGSRLIMTDYNTSNSGIYFVNPANGQFERKLTRNPDGQEVNKTAEIVMSPTHAYVVNQGSKVVSVVDLAEETISASISLPGTPKGATILPDYSRVFIGSGDNNQIWVINTSSNAFKETWTVAGILRSARLVASIDGRYIIIREFRGNHLAFVETSSGQAAKVLDLGYEGKTGNNNDLAVADDYVYVSSSDGYLTKLQISTQAVVAEIRYKNFQGIDVFPSNELLLAAVRDVPSRLAVILPQNLKIIREITIGGTAPWDVAIRPQR